MKSVVTIFLFLADSIRSWMWTSTPGMNGQVERPPSAIRRSPQGQDRQFGRAGEADSGAGGADAAGDEEVGVPAGESAIDVVVAVFDGFWRVVDERNPALPAVGVAGELQQDVAAGSHGVEVVGLVDQCDHRRGGGDSPERFFGIRSAAPDEIRAGDCQGFSTNGEQAVLVDEEGDAGFFKLASEARRAGGPSVVISHHGEDAVSRAQGFQLPQHRCHHAGIGRS